MPLRLTAPMVEIPVPRFGNAVVREKHVDEVVCHRIHNDTEEYLVKWHGEWPENRVAHSWHPICELAGADGLDGSSEESALKHVQQYIDSFRKRKTSRLSNDDSKKRKRYESHKYRLSPIERTDETNSSRASSLFSTRSDSSSRSSTAPDDCDTYNCTIEIKGGHIVAKASFKNTFDSRILPTQNQKDRANNTKPKQADNKIRAEFMRELKNIRGVKPVKLVNIRDESTPPLAFHFIDDCIYREGVIPPDPNALVGCESCRPNMGGFCGCEYTKLCECLEFAEVNESKMTEEEVARWKKIEAAGGSSMGLPKRFPYSKGTGLLVTAYLNSGFPIYECNQKCNCGGSDEYTCKSRVVQHGRQVPLEIFKTRDRGWGLRCTVALRMGEFVDTYRGEVVTDEEASIREDVGSKDKDSYLFSLDKFDENETKYVIDGQDYGGPTRFINHSCDPNCGIYGVSYDKNNTYLYELAFFAVRDIPANTELTFDYNPLSDDRVVEEEEKSVEEDSIPCRCGAKNCRKWLWK